MDLQLSGKVALITGGSMGLGRAVAVELAREGVDVAIVARGLPLLRRAADEIREQVGKSGGRVLPVAADTTDSVAVRSAVDETIANFGRLDILVNGAAHPGGLVRSSIDDASADGLLEDLDIKVVGYFRCCKAVVPQMRRQRYGRIINIGGLTGRGSKQISGMRNVAVSHLTKTLSDQLGPDGITVNAIHPGVVETPHIRELYEREAIVQQSTPSEIEQNYIRATPIRRVLQPEEIGSLIAFIASTKAGAITGESIGIDGGISRGIFL